MKIKLLFQNMILMFILFFLQEIFRICAVANRFCPTQSRKGRIKNIAKGTRDPRVEWFHE